MLRRQRREEEGERMHCRVFYLHTTLSPPFLFFKRLSKLLEKSHDRTKQESMSELVRARGWLYLSKGGWREERKEELKSSVYETKAKAVSLLPFLFFLATRQLQLRCN